MAAQPSGCGPARVLQPPAANPCKPSLWGGCRDLSHGLLTAARTLLRLGPAAVACVGRDLPSARVCCARRGQRLRGSPARAEPAVPGYACHPTKASTTNGRPCWRAAYCLNHLPTPACTWPRGVTVSTLDSESSDRGSTPREIFIPSLLRALLIDHGLHLFAFS